MSATLKTHDYKGYTIEEHNVEIFLGGKSLGHEKWFFITKGKDRFGMPILVRFLRLNGQQVKINSIATAKRFITLYENKKGGML